jgi:DNA-dependent RNA polymerase auxiliary subunit epsilon
MTLRSVQQMWHDSTSKTYLLIMASLVTAVIISIGLAFGIYGRTMFPAITTNSNAVPAVAQPPEAAPALDTASHAPPGVQDGQLFEAVPALKTEQERYYEALQQAQSSAPQLDTTALYLRAEQEQAIRELALSAPQLDTTALYLLAQEEQAIRTLRESQLQTQVKP